METPPVELSFKYSGSGRRITILEPLVGKNGSLAANRLTVKALESEDYIVLGAVTDDGLELDAEQARRLFSLTASTGPAHCDIAVNAAGVYSSLKNIILNDISERNALFFEEEMDKLNRWAEDRRKSLKYTLKIYDDRIYRAKERRSAGAESTGKNRNSEKNSHPRQEERHRLAGVRSGCPGDRTAERRTHRPG
jgi:hypothetical protein